MSKFTVFPAIDLRGGKVVRLAQGDPNRQTTYGDDPVFWAERWQAEGAEWLHVINLDGAFSADSGANWLALENILKTGLKIEFGGGIRTQKEVQAALDLGVQRVFLGTATIQNPKLIDWAIAAYGPEKIAGDIGLQNGKVMVKGWQEETGLTLPEIGARLKRQGVRWCVLTDVRRDGVGSGVEVANAVRLQAESGMQVVASGGVSQLDEIQQVRQAGLAGVIIGRALYDGAFSLREALKKETS